MKHRHTSRHRRLAIPGIGVAAVLVTALLATHAVAKVRPPAKKDKDACVEDYTKGKELAEAAELRASRERFAKCAKASCGGFIQQECGHHYTQLDSDIPSVVPFVTDETGTPRALVAVKVDGALLTSRLDGHALQVDPGKREFSFETDDGVFATRKVMVLQGQHNIPVKAVLSSGRRKSSETAMAASGASLRPAAFEQSSDRSSRSEGGSSAEKPGSSAAKSGVAQAEDDSETSAPVDTTVRRSVRSGAGGIPVLSYVFGGVGLAGVAGYFVLNTWGRKDNDALGPCSDAGNLCQPSDIDHVRRLYLAANISGGVGLAALATSAYLYYRSTTSVEETAPTRTVALRGHAPSIRMIDVQAHSSGALAMVGGAF